LRFPLVTLAGEGGVGWGGDSRWALWGPPESDSWRSLCAKELVRPLPQIKKMYRANPRAQAHSVTRCAGYPVLVVGPASPSRSRLEGRHAERSPLRLGSGGPSPARGHLGALGGLSGPRHSLSSLLWARLPPRPRVQVPGPGSCF
jgi:hypothetical protein